MLILGHFLLHLHAQVLSQALLIVFLLDALLLYGVLILLDALVVLVEHHGVVRAALLELLLEVEPGVVIATLRRLINHLLSVHRMTALRGLVILACVLRQAVQEKRKALLILPASAHEIGLRTVHHLLIVLVLRLNHL